MALVSAGLLVSKGLPSRFPRKALEVAAYVDMGGDPRQREGECFLTPTYGMQDFRPDVCLPADDGRPSLLLVGDSHAAAMYASLAQAYGDRDVLYAAASGCPPLLPETPNPHSRTCQQMREFLFADVMATRRIDTVVLMARWQPADVPGLEKTVIGLRQRGQRVVVVGPNMEFDHPEPRLLVFALKDGSLSTVAQHQSRARQDLDGVLSSLARTKWHIPYISVYEDLCAATCPLFVEDSVPLLGDKNHLTPQANLRFAEVMRAGSQIP